MLLTTVALGRQFSHLWKQSILFAFLTIIIGSVVVYIYAQGQYTAIIGQDYQFHWQTLQELQQEIHGIVAQNGAALTDERIKRLIALTTQKCARLFRVSLLDLQGNLLWGQEAASVTAYYRNISAAAPQKISRLLAQAHDSPLLNEQIHAVQLPLLREQQPVGFLRGEFFLIDSGATLLKVTKVTLQITVIAASLMILSGLALIFAQIVKHLAAKQHRLEASVVSLEKANENLRRTQKQLQVSEKLASLGYLAAGLAHEIGNPLGAVLGYVELLQKNAFDREKAQDILRRAAKELERIRGIIQELVNFSRPQALNLRTVDVNAILRKIVAHLPAETEKKVEIKLRLAELPLLAEVDEHKLENVFFNLLRNGLDAIAAAGRIRIATGRQMRASAQNMRGAEVIAIRFADTGCGISEKNLTKIFEPFFTTKDPGKGMGLGLPLCHRIIESLNGEIEVHSTVGQGTEVTVFLPPAPKNSLNL